MSEPKTVHLWMRDGRSLCDRRARPAPARDEAELEVAEREFREAPMCGSCMLLMSSLRRELATLNHGKTTVWPRRPSEAWANLSGTRWAGRFDLAEVAQNADLYDDKSRFNAYMLAIDPASIRIEEVDPNSDD